MTLICKNRILSRLFKGQKPFDGSDFGFVCCMKNGKASLKTEQTDHKARAPGRSSLFSPVKATSRWGVTEGISHGSRCSVARAQPASLPASALGSIAGAGAGRGAVPRDLWCASQADGQPALQ